VIQSRWQSTATRELDVVPLRAVRDSEHDRHWIIGTTACARIKSLFVIVYVELP
jgi:hypothetical protein